MYERVFKKIEPFLGSYFLVKYTYYFIGGIWMGVYDMVVANVECPFCGKETRYLEQINKGSYAMRTYYIGDVLPRECRFYGDIWKYDINCSDCKKHFKINFYFENHKFTKAVVFDSNWIKKETYYKTGKKSPEKSLDELQSEMLELRNSLSSLKKEEIMIKKKMEDVSLAVLRCENEIKRRFQLK